MGARRTIAPTLLFKELDGGSLIRASHWDLLDELRFAEMMLAFAHTSNFIHNAI
jgi:hypothetical protein